MWPLRPSRIVISNIVRSRERFTTFTKLRPVFDPTAAAPPSLSQTPLESACMDCGVIISIDDRAVGLGDAEARMRQAMGHLAVVGEQEKRLWNRLRGGRRDKPGPEGFAEADRSAGTCSPWATLVV